MSTRVCSSFYLFIYLFCVRVLFKSSHPCNYALKNIFKTWKYSSLNIFYKTICQFFYFRVSHFIKGTICINGTTCKIFFFLNIQKSLEQSYLFCWHVYLHYPKCCFAFYWLFSYTDIPIQHSLMATHTYIFVGKFLTNLHDFVQSHLQFLYNLPHWGLNAYVFFFVFF